jgi:cytochrome c oxidase assembly protein Cox11
MFCQKTGYGGAPKTENVDYRVKAQPVASRPLTIRFNADVAGGGGGVVVVVAAAVVVVASCA